MGTELNAKKSWVDIFKTGAVVLQTDRRTNPCQLRISPVAENALTIRKNRAKTKWSRRDTHNFIGFTSEWTCFVSTENFISAEANQRGIFNFFLHQQKIMNWDLASEFILLLDINVCSERRHPKRNEQYCEKDSCMAAVNIAEMDVIRDSATSVSNRPRTGSWLEKMKCRDENVHHQFSTCRRFEEEIKATFIDRMYSSCHLQLTDDGSVVISTLHGDEAHFKIGMINKCLQWNNCM